MLKRKISVFLVVVMIASLITPSFGAVVYKPADPVDEPISAYEPTYVYEPTEAPYEPTEAPYEPTEDPYGGDSIYHPTDFYTVSEDTPYSEETIEACGGDIWDTQTIYFQAPLDDGVHPAWENKYNTFPGPDDTEPYMHVCVYWWEGVGSKWPNGAASTWVGYQAHLIDKENRIYSAQIPASGTPVVVWNNGVNGGTDPNQEIFNYSCQLTDASVDGALPGDYDTLPEGTPDPGSMDGCIQIVRYDYDDLNELTLSHNYNSDWYIYYGNGCYGNFYSNDYLYSPEENCVNPEHFDYNGNHVGKFIEPVEPEEPKDGYIYFDAVTAGWESASSILFYIYEIGGDALGEWGSIQTFGGTKETDRLWSFDAESLGIEAGKQYGIIFENYDTTGQTADLLLDTTCFGDTAYVNKYDLIENPVDSTKRSMGARWINSGYGPIMSITSIGSVVGDTVPANTSKFQMFVDFLASGSNDGLRNALTFSYGADAQTLIDEIAEKLGLDKNDVIKAIEDAYIVGHSRTGDKYDWSSQWSAEDSILTEPGFIFFDAASAGWEDASSILFYIYEIGGDELGPWGSKKKLGGIKGTDDIWRFDAGTLGVKKGKQYGIIFNNYDSMADTYPLLLDTSCFDDTAYVIQTVRLENPVDSNKSSYEARWKESSYGPIMQITSIGNIVGDTVPANTSKYQMMVNFLASAGSDGLRNALNFNGETAQKTIDRIASVLELKKADVRKAIEEAANIGNEWGDTYDWSDEWNEKQSTLDDDFLPGDVNGDGKVSIADYSKMNKHVCKVKFLSEEEIKRGDVNGDGKVTIADLSRVNKHICKVKYLW